VGTSPLPGNSLKPSIGLYAICETGGVQGHTSVECYNGSSSMEHANTMHTFNLSPPQHNPYSNVYSLGWKSYSNPSFKNPRPQAQNAMQPLEYPYRALYNPPPPPP